jgi:hypothetical protein
MKVSPVSRMVYLYDNDDQIWVQVGGVDYISLYWNSYRGEISVRDAMDDNCEYDRIPEVYVNTFTEAKEWATEWCAQCPWDEETEED